MPPVRSKSRSKSTNTNFDIDRASRSGSGYPSPISMSRSSSGESSSVSRGSTPDAASLEEIVRWSLGLVDTAVDRIDLLPKHLHRIYRLDLSNGNSLVIKCSPSHRTRLLRFEQSSLKIEALILDLLSKNTSISVPELIKQEHGRCAIGAPFLLLSHSPGTALSRIASKLSPACRRKIDLNIGSHVRALASLKSSSFGCPLKVSQARGCHSWKSAFAWMLESLLRDAEDALINIPFDHIRHQVHEHGNVLEDIIDARLVRLDAGNENSIFVDESNMDIKGVVGWSCVIWGDPMMTDLLCNNPSEAFIEGYGRDFDTGERGQARQLLYTMFHALAMIVKQTFRPASEISELAGRRKLTSALIDLALLELNMKG